MDIPTQRHLLVADIADDIILTKEGGAALILKSSALNFSLLSEKEQEATTYAYSAFLNSLSFPIQIYLRSQRKDVSNYLDFLKGEEAKQTNPKLKSVMASYRDFVSQIVKKRNVLEKEFYIVVPFSPYELGVSAGQILGEAWSAFRGTLSPFGPTDIMPNTKKIPFAKDYVVKKAKTALYPRRDHVIRQSGRFGVKLRQLTTEELGRLLFNIYRSGRENVQNGHS